MRKKTEIWDFDALHLWLWLTLGTAEVFYVYVNHELVCMLYPFLNSLIEPFRLNKCTIFLTFYVFWNLTNGCSWDLDDCFTYVSFFEKSDSLRDFESEAALQRKWISRTNNYELWERLTQTNNQWHWSPLWWCYSLNLFCSQYYFTAFSTIQFL